MCTSCSVRYTSSGERLLQYSYSTQCIAQVFKEEVWRVRGRTEKEEIAVGIRGDGRRYNNRSREER